jgi:methylenetetrahydrofolate dehydrogenase (NADP+)/methenyltetrahydrofolate cyclohydrolase
MVIDGKYISNLIKEHVRSEIEKLKHDVYLVVIMVGNNPASQIYVRNKKKACEEVGIHCIDIPLPEKTTERELIAVIEACNYCPNINGILVQLPLPSHINERTIIEAIDPIKDVDGFSYENIGKLWTGNACLVPCTPAGIIEMLDLCSVDIAGQTCVIVGRSNIVGKPMAALMLERDATVIMCHSKTKDLASFTRQADILIAAVGKSKFITADMVKDGAVVIDVGMNRDENGKLCGDVDFENIQHKASLISKTPGGTGLTTVAMLMENTLHAAQQMLDK